MLALVCPACGGPLPSQAAVLPLVTCAYCSVSLSRREHTFDAQEGSVAKPPSNETRQRLSAFSDRIAAGIEADGDPQEVLKGVLHEQLGLESEAEVVARIAMGLAAEVRDRSGVDVSRDALILCRIAEAYLVCLEQLRQTHTAELNLPFLTASSRGPVHFVRTITIADLQALATAHEPGAAPRENSKKKWWWPF